MNRMTLQEFWNNREKLSESKPIEYKGKTFKGGVYSNGYALWFDDGLTSIPTEKIRTLEDLEKRLDLYIQGNYVCVECLKVVPKIDKNGYERWFAAIYCNDCFTKEYREERDWDYTHLD